MPGGGGSGNSGGGLFKSISDHIIGMRNRRMDNLDYAYRRELDFTHAANLSNIQHGHAVREIKTAGKQERKLSRTNTSNQILIGQHEVNNIRNIAPLFQGGKAAAISSGGASGSGILAGGPPTGGGRSKTPKNPTSGNSLAVSTPATKARAAKPATASSELTPAQQGAATRKRNAEARAKAEQTAPAARAPRGK